MAEPANPLRSALDQLWQRFLPETRARLALLAAASEALKKGGLVPALQAEAHAAAHKLAGTLGTFGLAQGTELSRQAELLLAPGSTPDAGELAALARQLEAIIDSRPRG